MEQLSEIFSKYGAEGLLLLVLIYVVLQGQFTFRYPRDGKKQEKK